MSIGFPSNPTPPNYPGGSRYPGVNVDPGKFYEDLTPGDIIDLIGQDVINKGDSGTVNRTDTDQSMNWYYTENGDAEFHFNSPEYLNGLYAFEAWQVTNKRVKEILAEKFKKAE